MELSERALPPDETAVTMPALSPTRRDTQLVYGDKATGGTEVRLTLEANGAGDVPPVGGEKPRGPGAHYNRLTGEIHAVQTAVHGALSRHMAVIKTGLRCLAVVAYAVYLLFVILCGAPHMVAILTVSALIVACLLSAAVMRRFGTPIKAAVCAPLARLTDSRVWGWCKW